MGQRFRERPRRFCQPRPLWAVGLLLVLALVLRLGYVAVTPGYSVVDDARDHDIHARSIDASQGFAHIGPGPAGRTAFRPPGYPYLLAGAYALSGVERAQTSTRVVVGRSPTRSWAPRQQHQADSTKHNNRREVGPLQAIAPGPAQAIVFTWRSSACSPRSSSSEPPFAALLLGALTAAIQHRRSAHRYRWHWWPAYSPA